MQNRTSHTIYFTRFFFQQKFRKVSKKARFGPFFTNKIFSTHKRKVVGHEKLVNIGPSDQVFIGGKVVLIPNNPAEESQVISFSINNVRINAILDQNQPFGWLGL